MSHDSPSTSIKVRKKKSLLWRGLKYGLWIFLLLIAAMVVFHRPLLHFALDKGGKHFAQKAGLKVDWQMGGSVISNVTLQEVRVLGEKGLVRKLEWKKLELDYDVTALWGGELSGLVNKVLLYDAEIELDLRGGKSKDKSEDSNQKKEGGGMPDVWVGEIDLQRVNVKLKTDGGEILVRGLTLQLKQDAMGQFEVVELRLPGGNLHLQEVAGRSGLTGRAVVLEQLQVRPGVRIQHLVANLQELANGRLPFGLEIESGEGNLMAAGELWLQGKFGLEASLAMRGITEADVANWAPLPENLKWRVEHGALLARGYPSEPRGLDFSLWLHGSGLEVAGQRVNEVGLIGTSEAGHLKMKELLAELEGNFVNAQGVAELPQVWSAMKNSEAEVQWSLVAGAIDKIKPDLKVTGTVQGSGEIVVGDGALKGAAADVEISPLEIPDLPLSFVKLKAKTDGGKLILDEMRWWVDERHEARFSGALELSGQQRGEVSWQVTMPEAGRWVPESVWSKGGVPMSISVTGLGLAHFSMPALKEKDWSSVEAETQWELTDLRWGEASMESLKLDAQASKGEVTLRELDLTLDENNGLVVNSKSSLDMKGPFEINANVNLKVLSALNPWLNVANVEKVNIENGDFSMRWNAAGKLDWSELRGGGSMELKGGKLAGRSEEIALMLEAQHEGWNAEVRTLRVSAGALQAEGEMTLSPQKLYIAKLTMHSGELKLFELFADVPLVLDQQPRPKVPLQMDGEWQVKVDLNEMKVAEVLDQVGMKAPVTGVIDGLLEVSGTPEKPVANIDLKLSEVMADAVKGKLEAANLSVQLSLQEEQLKLTAVAKQAPLEDLELLVELPLQMKEVLNDPTSILDATMKGRLSLPSSDISVAKRFAPVLSTLEGTLMTDVELAGSLRKPDWKGQLKVDVTNLVVQEAPMDFKEVRLHLGFEQKLIQLQDVSAMVAGGSVRVGGQVNLGEIANPQFDVELRAREALLMRDETMSLRTDGDLRCQGSLNNAAVTGRLELVRGRVFREVEFLPLSLPNQLPPPPPPVKRSAQKLELPALIHDWTFDVTVRTRDPIRLLGNVLNGGVVVDVAAKGTGAQPEISGMVSLKDARLRLPFSRLNITKGDIIIEKDRPFDPQLDLQGDSFINNYQVTLYGYGPALDPKLRFTSSPPLSEGEIATLLATGATSGNLRSSEGLAANRAAFLLISKVYRKMFNKAAPRRYDEEPPKLSFNFSPLSTGGTQRSVSATYELSPKLQAVGIISESGSFRGLLYYLVRFR